MQDLPGLGISSLRPTAIRVVSSSIRRPKTATGRAFSHAPDSFLLEARRRALDLSSAASLSKDWSVASILGESHSLCLWDAESVGENCCVLETTCSVRQPLLPEGPVGDALK